MRVAWFAVLLISIGCRAVPGTAVEFPGRNISSPAKPLSSTTNLATAHSDIVPVAFSTESEHDAGMEGDSVSAAVYWRPTLQDNATSPSESIVPALPMLLTLDTAIQTALARNPDLVAIRSSEPAAHAAYRASEVYPWNPFVQVQVLPYARDKAGDTLAVNHYVWLMQTIELAHQQRYRETSARAALNQVRWNIVAAELTNVAQTERLYFTTLYQRELRNLARRAATLNQELSEIVNRRFQAGLATASERTLARVTVRQSRRQAELAEANYQTSLLSLQRQLNLLSAKPLSLIGSLEEFTWLPVRGDELPSADDSQGIMLLDDFVADLALHRPDVLAAQSAAGMARANQSLARANQIQNVAIGPFYERDESGTVFVGFRTQMVIPVWNTGRELTVQRGAEANLQVITFQQLRSRAEVEAKTAIERYERARRMLKNERVRFSEMGSDELQDIKKQFASGQANILNVFSIQNTLLQERRTALDLLNEVAQACADVSLLAGLPPARLVTMDSKTPRGLEEFPEP